MRKPKKQNIKREIRGISIQSDQESQHKFKEEPVTDNLSAAVLADEWWPSTASSHSTAPSQAHPTQKSVRPEITKHNEVNNRAHKHTPLTI